ncbi:MAG: hypothetical protein AAGI17_00530 [Planctomycetota bacterium]
MTTSPFTLDHTPPAPSLPGRIRAAYGALTNQPEPPKPFPTPEPEPDRTPLGPATYAFRGSHPVTPREQLANLGRTLDLAA